MLCLIHAYALGVIKAKILFAADNILLVLRNLVGVEDNLLVPLGGRSSSLLL